MDRTARSTALRGSNRGARLAPVLSIALTATVFFAAPAQAAFHLVTIQEVFVGPPNDGILRPVPLTPDQRAQYVMLRMTSSGQTFLSGTSLRVEDADGVILGNFGSFGANVSNGGAVCSYPSCPAIVIGTQAAKNLFTFNFDQIVDSQTGRVALPPSGGRVCFLSGASIVDCVAWGNFDCTRAGTCGALNALRAGEFSANGCDTNWGTPASALAYGTVLEHGAAFNCAAKTNSSDYSRLFPKPVNNAGANNNADADADGMIDQLDCNDGSTSFLWPPTEVQNERVTTPNPATIAWSSQATTTGSGVTYQVIKGHLAHMANFTDASCFVASSASAGAVDPSLPAPGDGFYYVERAKGCTAGTYGSGFSPATSRDIVLAPVCP